jgi:CarD family transcriptional regulator
MVTKKAVQRLGFKTGEYIVYPAHGVGLITAIEEQEVAGLTLELFVISFEQAMDRMSREIGAVNRLTLTEAVQLIEKNLAKSPRRNLKTDASDAEEAAA